MKRYAPLVISLAAAWLALAAAPAWALPRQQSWMELRTANFTLFSDAGEGQVRRIGADLERLRDALAQLAPGLPLSSPAPIYIFVFRSADEFRPYQRTYNGQAVNLAGYFLSRPLANYVAIDGGRRGNEKGTIYHEYLHYVLRNNYASLPLWLHEGLAEYFSTFEVGTDEARIGLPIAEHVTWLRRNPLIPLATLFAVDERSPEYNETSRRGTFYAQSWVLVHYLISGNPERRRQASEYLRLAQAGTAPEKLFAQAFGADPAQLERELRNYVKSYLFNFTRVPIRREANLAMETRPMAWADVLHRLGDLLVNLGEEGGVLPEPFRAAADEHFRAALAAQPNHGPALAGLGHLAERAARLDEAGALYRKAAELAADDFLVQYLHGRYLLENDAADDALLQARLALQKVVRLQPDFGEAWAQLGFTYQAEEVLPPEAVQALETAHRLLPSQMAVVHNLAIVYARTGKLQQAEELVEKELVQKGEAELAANAREALLDQEYLRAEDLLAQGQAEGAIAIFQQIQARTSREARRTAMAARIEEVRRVQSFNRFVDQYNEAVALANQGDVQGATALLKALVESTPDATQAEQARRLLEKLQPQPKARARTKPR